MYLDCWFYVCSGKTRVQFYLCMYQQPYSDSSQVTVDTNYDTSMPLPKRRRVARK